MSPFLAYKVSAEKSTDSPVGVLLYIFSCFAAFKIFFLSFLGSLPPVMQLYFYIENGVLHKLLFGKQSRWEEEV